MCSTCGHEVFNGRHLGHFRMDMHHLPTEGQRPQGFGRALEWWHEKPFSSRAVVVDYIGPNGEWRPVRSYPDGRREPITVIDAVASRKVRGGARYDAMEQNR